MVKSITHRDDSIHVIVRKRKDRERWLTKKIIAWNSSGETKDTRRHSKWNNCKKRKIPTLTIMRVGERADDIAYEQSALKRMAKIGVVQVQGFPNNVEEEDFLTALRNNNENSCIHGILIFALTQPFGQQTN